MNADCGAVRSVAFSLKAAAPCKAKHLLPLMAAVVIE